MTILVIISSIVLVLVALVFISGTRQRRREQQMKTLEYDNPVPQEKLPFLALGNILLLGQPKKTLKILEPESAKKRLADDWDINGRESAVKTIKWLLDEGHREVLENNYAELRQAIAKGHLYKLESNFKFITKKLKKRIGATDEELQNCVDLSAFDFERSSTIARLSYNLDFISEDECCGFLEEAYKKSADVYKSWRDYAIAFYVGFTVCVNTPNPTLMITYTTKCLNDENSLWNLYPLKSE